MSSPFFFIILPLVLTCFPIYPLALSGLAIFVTFQLSSMKIAAPPVLVHFMSQADGPPLWVTHLESQIVPVISIAPCSVPCGFSWAYSITEPRIIANSGAIRFIWLPPESGPIAPPAIGIPVLEERWPAHGGYRKIAQFSCAPFCAQPNSQDSDIFTNPS